ncbi:retrovirus-related Pol polyprotein from transposon TNT 1-94, partial [Trifolium pratense]
MNKGCKKERKENKASQEQALYAKNGGQWNKNGKGKNKWKGEKNKGKGEFSNDQNHHNGDQDQSESSKKDSFIKGKNGGKKSDKSKIQCYSYDSKGKVIVQRKNGNHTFVTDVLYVPTMKHNLLSLGQLLEKGFNYSTKDHCIEVFDPQNKLILKSPLSKNRTFKVNLQASEIQCFSSLITEDEKWLWHY